MLTIREPWASLVGCGVKIIETRSWPTSYRGELYIHAGVHKISEKDERAVRLSKLIPDNRLHYGEIFMKCNLVDCIKIDEDYAKKYKPKHRKTMNAVTTPLGDMHGYYQMLNT